jgi:hypothetical protein|nr:MAG TPA: hypothetical protein [Bacteriophage sp.]
MSSILEMEVEIKKVVDDLRGRIFAVYDKYQINSGKVIELPSYDELVKSRKLQYNIERDLTTAIDEMLDLKLRISVVTRNLNSIKSIQVSSRTEYNLVTTFKRFVEESLEELDTYKFEITEIIKNLNNKIRIITSVQFSLD